MTVPQITPLPNPPTTEDIENFDERADEFLPAIVQAAEEMNTAILFINEAAMDVDSMESIRDDAIQARDDTQAKRELALQEIGQTESGALDLIEQARQQNTDEMTNFVDQAQDSVNVAAAARDIALSTVGLPPVDEGNLRRLFWPVGMRQTFGQEITDGVWLPEDGKAYQQSEYPELFDVIGHSYVSDLASRELASETGLTDVVIKGDFLLGKKDGEFSVFRVLDGFALHKLDTPNQPIVNAGVVAGFDGQHVFSAERAGYTLSLSQYTVQGDQLALRGSVILNTTTASHLTSLPLVVTVERGIAAIACPRIHPDGPNATFYACDTPTGPKKFTGSDSSQVGISAVDIISESEIEIKELTLGSKSILSRKANRGQDGVYNLPSAAPAIFSSARSIISFATAGADALLVLVEKASGTGLGNIANADLQVLELDPSLNTYALKTSAVIYGPTFSSQLRYPFPLVFHDGFVLAGTQVFRLNDKLDLTELPRLPSESYRTATITTTTHNPYPVVAISNALGTVFRSADLNSNEEFFVPDERPFVAPNFPHIKA